VLLKGGEKKSPSQSGLAAGNTRGGGAIHVAFASHQQL
jgi:hypothetical protein